MTEYQGRKQFTLRNFGNKTLESPIRVFLPSNLLEEQLLNFPAFKDWLTRLLHNLGLQKNPNHTFHRKPYKVLEIDAQAADWFTPEKLGFVKIQAKVQTDSGDWLPGCVFLRGGSVGILVSIFSRSSHFELLLTLSSLSYKSTTKPSLTATFH